MTKFQFMVKLELNLPWKPVLAWPWGVKYVIDPNTNLIVTHEESWDIEPWEVSQSRQQKDKKTTHTVTFSSSANQMKIIAGRKKEGCPKKI